MAPGSLKITSEVLDPLLKFLALLVESAIGLGELCILGVRRCQLPLQRIGFGSLKKVPEDAKRTRTYTYKKCRDVTTRRPATHTYRHVRQRSMR